MCIHVGKKTYSIQAAVVKSNPSGGVQIQPRATVAEFWIPPLGCHACHPRFWTTCVQTPPRLKPGVPLGFRLERYGIHGTSLVYFLHEYPTKSNIHVGKHNIHGCYEYSMEENDETYHEQFHDEFHARNFEKSQITKLIKNLWRKTSKVSCNGQIFPNGNALRTKTKGHAGDHQLGSNSGPNSWYVCAQTTTGIFLFNGDVYPLGTYDIINLFTYCCASGKAKAWNI